MKTSMDFTTHMSMKDARWMTRFLQRRGSERVRSERQNCNAGLTREQRAVLDSEPVSSMLLRLLLRSCVASACSCSLACACPSEGRFFRCLPSQSFPSLRVVHGQSVAIHGQPTSDPPHTNGHNQDAGLLPTESQTFVDMTTAREARRLGGNGWLLLAHLTRTIVLVRCPGHH